MAITKPAPRSVARSFAAVCGTDDYQTAKNRLPGILEEMRGAKNASLAGTLGQAIHDEAHRDDPAIKDATRKYYRHIFATRCIESSVGLPTLAAWLGHKDGGFLCAQVYGHLCRKHSTAMAGGGEGMKTKKRINHITIGNAKFPVDAEKPWEEDVPAMGSGRLASAAPLNG